MSAAAIAEYHEGFSGPWVEDEIFGTHEPQLVACPHDNCRAQNLAVARFCRRCGRPVSHATGAVVRRVAMW